MKYTSFITLVVVILCSINALAMEDKKSLNTWQQAAPFAGHVVAYTTCSLFYGSKKGYRIDSNNDQLKYGYVTETSEAWIPNEKGHNLFQILQSEQEGCGNTPLINTLLKDSQVVMRLANIHEKTALLKALKNRTASMSSSYSQAIVLRALGSDKEVQSLMDEQKD